MAPYGNRIVDFDEEGVTFIFPPQLEDVVVIRLPLPAQNPVGKDPSVFDPNRVFFNVKLYQKINGTFEKQETFKVPFEIVIHFKDVDDEHAHAKGRDKVCAYYDAGIQDWIPFAKHGFNPKKYNLFKASHRKKKKVGFKGFGVATIKEWPDPAMGWGP